MKHIKVLVVDDSAFVGKTIGQILEAEPNIEVVGYAQDGNEAIEKRRSLNPDVITMDVMMPRLNGIEATRRLMVTDPVPIVMVSSFTGEGTKYTVEALSLGAIDCVLKPDSSVSIDMHLIADELIRKITLASRIRPVRRADLRAIRNGESVGSGDKIGRRTGEGVAKTPTEKIGKLGKNEKDAGVTKGSLRHEGKIPAKGRLEGKEPPEFKTVKFIVIGSSTGGPALLRSILSVLPGDYPIPIAIVQHITPSFFNELVVILNRVTRLNVKRVDEGETPRPGNVYMASPRAHTALDDKRRFRLVAGDVIDGHIPSATVLIESVADTYGAFGMGLILSGMGRDGAVGMKLLQRRKGVVYILDEASSVVYGMPKAVLDEGVKPEIVGVSDLPKLFYDVANKRLKVARI